MYPEQQQVYWHSGVYLQPQHLQSVDLHHSFMLARQRLLTQPWNVGIIKFNLNQDLLLDFTLKIEQLRAILPSGDYLEFPGNCVLLPRQFNEEWKQLEKKFMLWIALRRFDPKHINVGESLSNRWVRECDDCTMKDIHFEGPESNVSRILYSVQLLCDEEKDVAVDCELIPLLQLRYENNQVIIDPEFFPPSISIDGPTNLKSYLLGLCAELAYRTHHFEQFKRDFTEESRSSGNISQFLVLQSLGRTLLLLRHYCRTPLMHPWLIYGLLLQLAGELYCFSEGEKINSEWLEDVDFPPYDHFNLYACFSKARRRLMLLLDELALKESAWITLIPDEEKIFYGDLDTSENCKIDSAFIMLYSESIHSEDYIDITEFKIAPASDIATIIYHALPGIEAQKLVEPPHGISVRKDSVYFLLNTKHKLWKEVEIQKKLAFYWVDAPEDLQVRILFKEAI